MKLENQVTPIEMAKKLKDLGVTQESQCYWSKNLLVESGFSVYDRSQLRTYEDPHLMDKSKYFAAFSCAELGEMLPDESINGISMTEKDEICYSRNGNEFYVCLRNKYGDAPLIDGNSLDVYTTEASARAAMLIHLLENKLITVDEVNKKITK